MRLIGILAVSIIATSLCFGQTSTTTAPKYDADTEATLKGTVGEISEILLGNVKHVDFLLKSGTDVLDVGVCPADIFKELIVTLATGDEVEVIGSKVQVGDKAFVMAREIKKGNETLALRDKKGSPVWMWMKK
jgi:hypothetical protein